MQGIFKTSTLQEIKDVLKEQGQEGNCNILISATAKTITGTKWNDSLNIHLASIPIFPFNVYYPCSSERLPCWIRYINDISLIVMFQNMFGMNYPFFPSNMNRSELYQKMLQRKYLKTTLKGFPWKCYENVMNMFWYIQNRKLRWWYYDPLHKIVYKNILASYNHIKITFHYFPKKNL